jgi:hypothetical protein
VANEASDIRAGLRLPPDVIQPFLLRFRREDLHIMAFFEGHPDYEAVEAMIQHRNGAGPSIRAILTRHDQTQIDHVNDAALIAEARGADRQTCRRSISLSLDRSAGCRRARLEFISHADEPIVMDLTTVGEPDPGRGGISDPGNHSLNTSLPLMRRGASALAGPQTTVTIGGRRFDVPVKMRAGPFVVHEGYFTEHHLFGAVRAGTLTRRLKARPGIIGVGAEWIFEDDGEETIYRVMERIGGGQWLIANRQDSAEIITASADGERLAANRITRANGDAALELTFDDTGHFRLAMGGEGIVAGSVDIRRDATGAVISLRPAQPDWAVARPVQVACTRRADVLTCVTTIGAGK